MSGSSDRYFPFNGYLPAVIYLFFVILLGYSAAKQGLSHYYSDRAIRLGSESDAAAALRFFPDEPKANEVRGELFLRRGNLAAAIDAFERAVGVSQNNYRLWLRIGNSRSLLKQFDAAETAYTKALSLAPNYSRPNYDLGMMLLEMDQDEEAFRYLSRAADRDPTLYSKVLDLARTTFRGDPVAIENSINAPSHYAKKLVSRYLIEHSLMTNNTRQFLVSDALNANEKNEFVQILLESKSYLVARDVWLSRPDMKIPDKHNLIFDGGFEEIAESDPSGLGWQIDQYLTGTAVALDRETFHSGSSSLKVKFAGNVAIGKDLVSQIVNLAPGQNYRLSVFVNSSELVSAGPPRIVVHNVASNELLSSLPELQPTKGRWVEYKCDLFAKNSSAARISLQRTACDTQPCPIFGEVILDDLLLVKISDQED